MGNWKNGLLLWDAWSILVAIDKMYEIKKKITMQSTFWQPKIF